MSRPAYKRTCLRCGWVHFAVTRAYAEEQVVSFNLYYDAAPRETQEMFAGRSNVRNYERCSRCGALWTEFRPFSLGDCADGVTLGPIISEDEDGLQKTAFASEGVATKTGSVS